MGECSYNVTEIEVSDCGDGSVNVVVRFVDGSRVGGNFEPDPESGGPDIVPFSGGRRVD